MKHFTAGVWADLARGLLAEDEVRAARAHLASGCAQCKSLADFSSKFAGVAAKLNASCPPETVVRLARSVFPARWVQPARVVRIAAKLIFDSWLTPAPEGLRSTWHVGWQGLYRAGDCSVDLRIEPELNASRAAVVGQISNHNLPAEKMSGIPVQLRSGRSVVAETRSNQFGEFQLEYEQQTRLQLYFYLDGGTRCIQVPLKRFMPDKPGLAGRAPNGPVLRKRRAAEGAQ